MLAILTLNPIAAASVTTARPTHIVRPPIRIDNA
jgi:hypothetical protein